jgi:hypothetical protein
LNADPCPNLALGQEETFLCVLGSEASDSVRAAPRQAARLFFVDHLRAALVILVVLHHAAIVYGAAARARRLGILS